MKVFFTLLFVWLLGSTALWGQPADVVWNSQSRNSSGSMPCGGGDIGMNVWVHAAEAGTFPYPAYPQSVCRQE